LRKPAARAGIFVVTKGRGRSRREKRPGAPSDDRRSRETTVKLLLVEDNPLVLELVFRGLEHVCDVMVAHDGGDALLKTIDDPPDVILSDYKWPGMDGRSFSISCAARKKPATFLFCSWPAAPTSKSACAPWSTA